MEFDQEKELELLAEADARALRYTASVGQRRVYPDRATIDECVPEFTREQDELPLKGRSPTETLAKLDDFGSKLTTASNGPRYYGFVIGGSLPGAAAAERLLSAWDQSASTFTNSPAAATIEGVAGHWVLQALDLPAESVVGFGTSATACTMASLAAARRALLLRHGWDFDNDGFAAEMPQITVVISELQHISVKKALRILGFGLKRLRVAPVNHLGQIDVSQLPQLDDHTILCLQAGEVNTGEFDDFATLIPLAHQAGAWVHVDGAFGIWARASPMHKHLTEGVDLADSWTTDAHKWLNVPYDCAMAICRDRDALASAMNCDAVYAPPTPSDNVQQKNLTLEFSRRARGVPVWAALRTLGRDGIASLVSNHCTFATAIAAGLRDAGFDILNRVVLNQVLVAVPLDHPSTNTLQVLERLQLSGKAWCGATQWEGRPAMRISVSSWRTQQSHVDDLIALLSGLLV
eukprot:TRINITY_DN1275_c1_g1_i4.p1 TRINITY_DN1275_c1_g1~~TRINITY_DN1275_c1_g1_i4.p1  ORF type:complete len:464 (-),score=50.51 TRINITY_DN1275_c1_g1_i4:274-1665(-)